MRERAPVQLPHAGGEDDRGDGALGGRGGKARSIRLGSCSGTAAVSQKSEATSLYGFASPLPAGRSRPWRRGWSVRRGPRPGRGRVWRRTARSAGGSRRGRRSPRTRPPCRRTWRSDGLEGGRLLVPRLHELGRLSARPQAASSPLMPSPTYAKTWPTSRSRRPWRTWSDTFVSAVGTSVPASADASARGEGGTTMHGSPALAPSRSTTRRPASQRPVEASRLRPFRPHWGRIGRWPVACPAWMVTVGSALSCWSAPPCRRDASARPRRQPTSAWEEPVPPRARWRSSECFPRPFVTRPVHLLCRLPRATTHRSVRSGLRPHGGRWSALR